MKSGKVMGTLFTRKNLRPETDLVQSPSELRVSLRTAVVVVWGARWCRKPLLTLQFSLIHTPLPAHTVFSSGFRERV